MNPKFERTELFDHYHQNMNPFMIVTVPVDVTNVVNYCKIHKNFYATMGYLIMKAVNQIDAFKWRYENNEFHYYSSLVPSFTQKLGDNEIGYFDCEYNEDYDAFIAHFIENQNDFYQQKSSTSLSPSSAIWFSCIPWFSITSLVPPFDKNNTIPQFIWDKYEEKNGIYQVHLMILVHHGFADGFHIAKFLELLNAETKNLQKIENL